MRAEAASLAPRLAASDPEALTHALTGVVLEQQRSMLDGIARYRAHPYRRDLIDPPAIWRDGETRLLDYGGDGPTVLCICSLVNRAYVLDLSARRSLVRWLAARGVRPLLLDWGDPEADLDLASLMTAKLEPALAVAAQHGPVALLGYCMGGTLAVALASRQPRSVGALALLAAPWDFDRGDPTGLARAVTQWDLLGDTPIRLDLLQGYFTLLDPGLALRKFVRFATMTDAGEAADFVAIEDWLNDGVALPAGVARDCLRDWYTANAPWHGRWQVAGQAVDATKLDVPALVVVPGTDRIVPADCAAALAEIIPGADRLDIDGGHIGMVVGPRAESLLWRQLRDWLVSRAPGARPRRRPKAPAPRRTAPSRPAAAGAAAD